MRMLWLSFLLIGSITCGPVGKDFYGSNMADTTFRQQPSPSGYWYSGTGMSSIPGSSAPLPSLTNPSFDKATEVPAPQDVVYYSPSSYGNTNMAAGASSYNSPESGPYGFGYAGYDSGAPAGSYSGGYGSSAGGYGGYASYEYAPAGSAGGDETPEQVFSDVSDLEPVYSFSSRSNYQRGRAVFAQHRYIPEEPVPQPMPMFRSVSKTASKQSSPSKATKGRYN